MAIRSIKRYRLIWALTAAAVLVVGFSVPRVQAAENQRFVSIGTGGPKGVYTVAGTAICAMIEKESAARKARGATVKLCCSAPNTGGSTYNLSQLYKRAFDFGMVQSDWQFHAYMGTLPGTVKPNKNLRAVFSLHAEPFRLVVAKDSGIHRFGDLKKKRVNIGNPGSGHRATMDILMKRHGLTEKDFKAAMEFTTTEDMAALCNGKIDAYITSIGLPNPNESVLVEKCEARIVYLNSPMETELIRETPYYAMTRLPKGIDETVTEDVETIGVVATLVTRADVEEDTVYELVRSVMDNIDTFRKQHPALAYLDPRSMIKDGLTAPLHPGALRYYKEKGWM